MFIITLLWITYPQLFTVSVLVLLHVTAKYTATYLIKVGQVFCLAKQVTTIVTGMCSSVNTWISTENMWKNYSLHQLKYRANNTQNHTTDMATSE